jgi:hypothetical protein
MRILTSSDFTQKTNARTVYSSFIVNQRDLTNKKTISNLNFLESDRLIKNIGAIFTTYEEQQLILYEVPIAIQFIVNGNKSVSGSTAGLTQINFTGIFDAGYGMQTPITGVLDDAFVPIPMGGMVFNFFGTNYSNSVTWNSNNALIFGTTFNAGIVSVSNVTANAILFGNYDRLCTGLYYSNAINSEYSITTLIVTFTDYFTDPGTPTYKYQIRLIKETTGDLRQFVEVCIVSSPPSPGYSSNPAVTYPSGPGENGLPVDSNSNYIDSTKNSPYNITNGTAFINPCGSTFSTASPAAGTSFVFSSDATGSNWTFNNNSYINV